MKLGTPGETYISFPPNFQTNENKAFGYAVDNAMEQLHSFCQKISVWSDLDHVDPEYYDQLAVNLRAPYYASLYDNDTKLRILKSTLQTYMFAGTAKAEEELINKFFPDAEFIPWHKYDGKPFHFKIIVPTDPSKETVEKFTEILKRVKSARSIIDGIETKTYSIDLTPAVVAGNWQHERLEEM